MIDVKDQSINHQISTMDGMLISDWTVVISQIGLADDEADAEPEDEIPKP